MTDVDDGPSEAKPKPEKAQSSSSPSVDGVVDEVVNSKADDDEVIF